jgi:hypothetical protein
MCSLTNVPLTIVSTDDCPHWQFFSSLYRELFLDIKIITTTYRELFSDIKIITNTYRELLSHIKIITNTYRELLSYIKIITTTYRELLSLKNPQRIQENIVRLFPWYQFLLWKEYSHQTPDLLRPDILLHNAYQAYISSRPDSLNNSHGKTGCTIYRQKQITGQTRWEDTTLGIQALQSSKSDGPNNLLCVYFWRVLSLILYRLYQKEWDWVFS